MTTPRHTLPENWELVRHTANSDYGPDAYTLWPYGAIVQLPPEAAAVIHAAPKLLEALTNLWAVCDANGYEVPLGYRNQVFSAIAKATQQ